MTILPPPPEFRILGTLIASDGECAYFRDGRPSRTVYSKPDRMLTAGEYDRALQLGMRRSGEILYRPVCPGCRKCQPFRIAVGRFEPSRSQRRVMRKCEGKFDIRLHEAPRVDPEHVDLFARYQAAQHAGRGIEASDEHYARFLGESITETKELAWRDRDGRLVAVGILDIVLSGLSTVYFYWDPQLASYSLGIYSVLVEIELCRQMGKPYYYLGYLVPGAVTMNYKAQFGGGEVWNGERWLPTPGRGVDEPAVVSLLRDAELSAMGADERRFGAGA